MELHKQVEMNEIALHCNLYEFQNCNIKKGSQTKSLFIFNEKKNENFPGGPVAENPCC